MRGPIRFLRWLLVVGTAGVLPAFILDCDKAALNFQRGLMQGLGADVADIIIDQIPLEEGE
ncbi:MAG: hypothetical protein WBE26_14660 [Phycisphaerae bacterium]